jgi:hypothetical protein
VRDGLQSLASSLRARLCVLRLKDLHRSCRPFGDRGQQVRSTRIILDLCRIPVKCLTGFCPLTILHEHGIVKRVGSDREHSIEIVQDIWVTTERPSIDPLPGMLRSWRRRSQGPEAFVNKVRGKDQNAYVCGA